MDLWHRGLKVEANQLFNHYFQKASITEIEGLKLLPLFLSLRAAIRAMTGLHGLGFIPEEERRASIEEIQSYAALAESFLERAPAHLIAIGGQSGTGKSSAAYAIAPFIGRAPGALCIRSDVERKVMHGVDLTCRLPPSAYTGQAGYEVYRRLDKKAEVTLEAGHSVIADAVFPTASSRAPLREIAVRAGACFAGFWLDAPWEIKIRITARSGDASDADTEVAARQLRTVRPPKDWIAIDASGDTAETAGKIMSALNACKGAAKDSCPAEATASR
jgi:predicted kinase